MRQLCALLPQILNLGLLLRDLNLLLLDRLDHGCNQPDVVERHDTAAAVADEVGVQGRNLLRDQADLRAALRVVLHDEGDALEAGNPLKLRRQSANIGFQAAVGYIEDRARVFDVAGDIEGDVGAGIRNADSF